MRVLRSSVHNTAMRAKGCATFATSLRVANRAAYAAVVQETLLLLVDADREAQRAIGDAAPAAGLEVVTCDSARAGVNACCALEPAVIVVAPQLPDFDARWFVTAIREQPADVAATPMVVLADPSDAGAFVRLLHTGADVVLAASAPATHIVAQARALYDLLHRLRERPAALSMRPSPSSRRSTGKSVRPAPAKSAEHEDESQRPTVRPPPARAWSSHPPPKENEKRAGSKGTTKPPGKTTTKLPAVSVPPARVPAIDEPKVIVNRPTSVTAPSMGVPAALRMQSTPQKTAPIAPRNVAVPPPPRPAAGAPALPKPVVPAPKPAVKPAPAAPAQPKPAPPAGAKPSSTSGAASPAPPAVRRRSVAPPDPRADPDEDIIEAENDG